MIKTQFPYIDDNGREHADLIKTWTDNSEKVLLQVETGAMYEEAIDLHPCRFTYQEIDRPVEEETTEEIQEDDIIAHWDD